MKVRFTRRFSVNSNQIALIFACKNAFYGYSHNVKMFIYLIINYE